MAFIIEGSLYSQVCKDCTHPLLHAKIRFYRVEVTRDVFTEIAANTKETLRVLTPEQLKALDSQLVGEASLSENGDYSVELNKHYEQGPLRIVVEIHAPDGREAKQGPAYVYLTTFIPNWQYDREQRFGRDTWNYTIPYAFWCRLLEFWDLWVICGQVNICDRKGEPARGVHVRAMDADLITDDLLGTAVTDAEGHFSIYYHTLDFKRTFLSWIGINVETPFGGTLGPDVYFVIDSADGDRLLTETRTDGKKQGRKDVGHCFCVSLCIKVPGGPVVPPPLDPIWTKVGTAFTISTDGNPHDFDNDGFANISGRKYAIWDEISLNGQVPDPTVAACPLYRFRIVRSSRTNNLAATPESDFNVANAANVGASTGEFGPGLFAEGATLGTLTRHILSPVFMTTSIPVSMRAEDVDAEGWVDVRNAAQRAITEENARRAGLALPAVSTSLSSYIWSNDGSQLIRLNTSSLSVGEAPIGPVVLNAGDVFPPALRYSIPKVAIRFESKDRVTGVPRPGNGITLNAMVVSNASNTPKLVLKNRGVPVSDCVAFTTADEISAAYTIYHPNLGSAWLTAHSADGSYFAWNLVGEIPVPESSWVSNPGNHYAIVPTPSLPVTDESHDLGVKLVAQPDHTCTYVVRLHWYLLRHNGVIPEGGSNVEKFFFYQV